MFGDALLQSPGVAQSLRDHDDRRVADTYALAGVQRRTSYRYPCQ